MAGKLQLPSAAIRLQFLSSFTAARLSSLTSGTERTARGKHRPAKLDGRGIVMRYGHTLVTPL